MYVLDPENEGYTTYEAFVGVAALKIRAKDDNEDEREEEIDQGFELFTQGAEKITMRDLQRIAKLLKEDVDEGVLNDMILEANGGRGVGTGVDRVAFGDVMRRAGVFR